MEPEQEFTNTEISANVLKQNANALFSKYGDRNGAGTNIYRGRDETSQEEQA